MKTIKIKDKKAFFSFYKEEKKKYKRVGFKPDPDHKGILNLNITKEDVKNCIEYICETFYYDYVFTVYPNKGYDYYSAKKPMF